MISKTENILEVESVRRRLEDGRNLLPPCSLSVRLGECVAISGASGVGKSLLLRAIADLDPNDGDIRIDGVHRQDIPAPVWRSRVVYHAAESGWWSDRVSDHFLGDADVSSLMHILGLSDDTFTGPVSRLSTGEKQRFALIRSLQAKPQVLLLDEPTSALDLKTAESVESILKNELEHGLTIVLVSHDPALAERLAHRYYVMERTGLTAVDEIISPVVMP